MNSSFPRGADGVADLAALAAHRYIALLSTKHHDGEAPLFRYLPESLLYPLARDVLMQLQPEIDRLLFNVDWETRGRNVLALL